MDIDLSTLGLGLGDDDKLNISFNDDANFKDINFGSSGGSSNLPTGFGPGIELLINDKKRNNGYQPQASSEKDLGDLGAFDQKMNESIGGSWNADGGDFGNSGGSGNEKKSSGMFGGLFSGWGGSNIKTTDDVKAATDPSSYIKQTPKTWDGFTKTNEIPSSKSFYDTKQLNEREKRVKKRSMIDELERWYEKGYLKENQRFHRDTPYEEVEEEYDAVLEKIRRKKSVNLQKDILFNVMNFIEFSNSWVDPFGLKLEGLADKTTEELDSYEDIFGELYDKWKGGKVPPELALLCKVGFSIAMLHMSNNVLSSTPVAFQDVVKQSPELQRAWHDSVVKTMSESNESDGMSFITDILSNKMVDDEQPMQRKPAQIPVAGRNMNYTPTPSTITGRPDINAARNGSVLFREGGGVDIRNQYGDIGNESSVAGGAAKRPEMRGPRTNINDLLSGLKPMAPSGNQNFRNEMPVSRGREEQSMSSGYNNYDAPVMESFMNSVMENSDNEMMMEMVSGGSAMHESMISVDDANQLKGVSKGRRRKPRSERSDTGLDLGITDI
jgi:hypothetical protein